MTVGRANAWNEIVKKGYRYFGDEIGDNHTNISCLCWAALAVAKTVLFCTFHIPIILKSPPILVLHVFWRGKVVYLNLIRVQSSFYPNIKYLIPVLMRLYRSPDLGFSIKEMFLFGS